MNFKVGSRLLSSNKQFVGKILSIDEQNKYIIRWVNIKTNKPLAVEKLDHDFLLRYNIVLYKQNNLPNWF